MVDYPYDFGNGYKIQTVFANKTPDGCYGDIYDFASEVARAHPGAEILVGFCVIDEGLGLIPDGCNDWNETISAAIQDYEGHIVPILERDEDVELNYTEVNVDGSPVRETLFSVKSGWLQDYFDVDNRAQLEALLTNSEDWEPAEILEDAKKDTAASGLQYGDITEFAQETSQKDVAVQLGKAIYLDWEKIDRLISQWTKSYFGDHVVAQGVRDESDFDVDIDYLKPSDYEKYLGLFERYDSDKDYDPDEEFYYDTNCITIPGSVARGVMYEALTGAGLSGIGTAIATYDGVYFTKCDRDGKEQKILPSKEPPARRVPLDEQIKSAAAEVSESSLSPTQTLSK